MEAAFDLIGGLDLCGELGPPPPWEEVILNECRLCEASVETVVGLCRLCRDRLPRVGGCGLVLAVVLSKDLDHLIDCGDCRDYLDDLAELVRFAAMEQEKEPTCLR